jgi:hypothetical protein
MLRDFRALAVAVVSTLLHLAVLVAVSMHIAMLMSLKLGQPMVLVYILPLLEPVAWMLLATSLLSLTLRLVLGSTARLLALDLASLAMAVTALYDGLRPLHAYVGLAVVAVVLALTILHSEYGARLRPRAAPIPSF